MSVWKAPPLSVTIETRSRVERRYFCALYLNKQGTNGSTFTLPFFLVFHATLRRGGMMTTTTIANDKSKQLIQDGYCVFEQVLSTADAGSRSGRQRRPD